MTDDKIDLMVERIDEMAQRIGCRFIPDTDKILAFRRSQHEEAAHRAEYAKMRAKAYVGR